MSRTKIKFGQRGRMNKNGPNKTWDRSPSQIASETIQNAEQKSKR
jgi:hypothetical protein